MKNTKWKTWRLSHFSQSEPHFLQRRRWSGTLCRTRCVCCSISDAVAAGHPVSSSWKPQAGQHGVPRQIADFVSLEDGGKTVGRRWEDCGKTVGNCNLIIQTSTVSTSICIGPPQQMNGWILTKLWAFPFEGCFYYFLLFVWIVFLDTCRILEPTPSFAKHSHYFRALHSVCMQKEDWGGRKEEEVSH